MTPPSDLRHAKAELRARLKIDRETRSADNLAQANCAIRARLQVLAPLQQAAAVFVYISVGPEVATRELIDDLQGAGKNVLVPALAGRERMLAVAFPGWAALREGSLGIPSPVDGVDFSGEVDVALVPGLGFSPAGQRLGHGRGYYDRWLAGHPATLRIALAFEHQLLADIPVEPHDVAMDMLVTESRVIAPSARY